MLSIAERVAAELEDALIRYHDATDTFDPETIEAAETAVFEKAARTVAYLEAAGYANHRVTQELRVGLGSQFVDLTAVVPLVRDVRGLLRAGTGR
ncbi:hypothetical protein [Mycobacteroides abscessus]|uniref:hypothetical protein n=1 Tax=Mycobacteroides abscessus TaxID=36809 RepID=UPI0009A8FF4A|nr:hypothetical protein [Mycobacteroides abscessus]SLB84984.1 Uncharacterised protein [Mycobacteroides abscessus subsp. abscessus]SLH66423.1 Uncharacterised protein [Mycobacteroides abscessus subsp. abscessus]